MKHRSLLQFDELQRLAIAHLRQKLIEPQAFTRLCSLLVLTGMLSMGASLVVSTEAIALTLTRQPVENPTTVSALTFNENNLASQPPSSSQLPPTVATKLRQNLSQRTGIPPGRLRVIEAIRKNWVNGCLELRQPEELCTEAIVEGWRVTLTDGSRRWIYRTDARGLNLRLEPSRPIPTPTSEGNLRPTRISPRELPPPLTARTVFRAIASGGFIGRTYETTLTSDGQVIRVLLNPNGVPGRPEIHRISPQQVQQFQQLLQKQHLERFDRLNYPARPGSADFRTMTLSSHSFTVRYADTVQTQLPQSIQTMIQAWNQIARSS